MGYMHVMGSCGGCSKHLAFNPTYVPSIRINGEKEPLCKNCFARWNEIHRVSKDLEPVPLHPEAYEPEKVVP